MSTTNKLQACMVSIAATLETRKIKANEVPVVLGYLAHHLAQHTGLPLPLIIGMVNQAAHTAASSCENAKLSDRHE